MLRSPAASFLSVGPTSDGGWMGEFGVKTTQVEEAGSWVYSWPSG